MQIKKEKIDITPDKTIFSKMGQTGYSIGEALAELVDNAIDARYERNPVKISITLDAKKGYICVVDNGMGMNKDTASKSIVLAKSDKENRLGQFGLGLKTAAMSLGKKFTLETTRADSREEYNLVFDRDEFEKKGNWKYFEIQTKKGIDLKRSGTKVTIENLIVSFPANFSTYVRKQLRERFSPFILNKEVEIQVNDKKIEPETVDIVPGTKEKREIILSSGEKIKLWTAILTQGSMEKSGFNMYRKSRLIRLHEKLGYSYHPSKMAIMGEVYLDCIPVTHNKREFITTSPLYQEFLEKFQELIKPLILKAQQRQREKKIQDIAPEVKETIKDGLLRALKRVEDFQELAFPSTKTPAKRTKEGGQMFDKEMREKFGEIVEIKEKKVIKPSKGRTPKKVQTQKVRFITIGGRKYRFDFTIEELQENKPKISYTDKEKGLIMVVLNSRFPGLNIAKDQVFYVALFVAEGIVEEFLRQNSRSLDRAIDLRDKLFKEFSNITTEDTEENLETKIVRTDAARKKFLELESKNKKDISLSSRELEIARLRWGINNKPHTLQRVGEKLGITRERVRQIEDRAISKLLDLI